jgi:hypothetical protein
MEPVSFRESIEGTPSLDGYSEAACHRLRCGNGDLDQLVGQRRGARRTSSLPCRVRSLISLPARMPVGHRRQRPYPIAVGPSPAIPATGSGSLAVTTQRPPPAIVTNGSSPRPGHPIIDTNRSNGRANRSAAPRESSRLTPAQEQSAAETTNASRSWRQLPIGRSSSRRGLPQLARHPPSAETTGAMAAREHHRPSQPSRRPGGAAVADGSEVAAASEVGPDGISRVCRCALPGVHDGGQHRTGQHHRRPAASDRAAAGGVIEGVFGPAARDWQVVSAGCRAEGNRRGTRPPNPT